MRARRLALGIWLLVLIACAVVIARTPIRTNMSAFLPHSESMAQQALTDQATHGAASHIILIALEAAPQQALAVVSKSMAADLRKHAAFVEVANGGKGSFAGVRRFVSKNRYRLSPDVTPQQFTVAGLHDALENDLGLLSSNLGEMVQSTLPSDPTGQLMTLMGRLANRTAPQKHGGVWFSGDGSQALMVAHTRAAGFNIDGQQHALALIRTAFDHAKAGVQAAQSARLLTTGSGVFAVHTRDITKRQVTRLSILATAGAVFFLLFAYRSPRVLLLGLLPVISGAITAIAAVSLDFGFVHGVTLGFGVTLIGESIDYAIYLFTQTARGGTARETLARIWPTLRLGALTSIVGFSAMLFSRFVGFAQLGLFSIVGIITAASVTRFVLPHLVPRNFYASGANTLARPLLALMRYRRQMRLLVGALVLAAIGLLVTHQGGFWDPHLTDLSPIPAAQQQLNTKLQHELGMSGHRYFVVFRAPGEQAALQESETLAAALHKQVAKHRLGGFSVPSEILPSHKTQKERLAAIPDSATLHARFEKAAAGLPFREGAFKPFFHDAEAAKQAPLLNRSDLPPALSLQLQSMLEHRHGTWTVVAPLSGVHDPAGIAASVRSAGPKGAQFVDIKTETHHLLETFQQEATDLAVIGSLAILAVLIIGLRSPRRVLRVVAPLAAAVTVTAAMLTLGGGKLSIFMVVGFLLIVALGSNYCLFFERSEPDAETQRRSVASIVLANLCTVSAYGLMASSSIPVLHDIGMTVALGAFLSLIFAATIGARTLLDDAARGEG